MSDLEARYSIAELSSRAEVSRRAVRYYIQRGLLPAAHGAGRGSYYDDAHLTRLLELKEAQRSGVSLDALARGEQPRSAHTLAELRLERWLRLPCADGVELSVRSGTLNPDQLVELSALIQRFIAHHPHHPSHPAHVDEPNS